MMDKIVSIIVIIGIIVLLCSLLLGFSMLIHEHRKRMTYSLKRELWWYIFSFIIGFLYFLTKLSLFGNLYI